MPEQLNKLSPAKAKAAVASLPEESVKAVKDMLLSTWDACASDWLALFEPNERCKGIHVQECVADADRFEMGGSKETAAFWRGLPREVQDVILNDVFPKTRTYGY